MNKLTDFDVADTSHPLSRLLPKGPRGPMQVPARALGWFSIGLGLAELLMPRAVARSTGMRSGAALVRLYGLRELGVGVGLLNSQDPTPWLWGRVAGDLLDVATVATAVPRSPVRALLALAALGGVMALDATCASAARPRPRTTARDYSARSGFAKPIDQMRGAARQIEGLWHESKAVGGRR